MAKMSKMELAMMKRLAKEYEKQAIEKAFLYMLAIPLNILVNDYWSKSAKKKAPKFIEEVCSLYESVQNGIVSDQELVEFLHEYAGITVEASWLKETS